MSPTLRILTAAAVLISAWIHLRLWLDGYRDIDIVGPLFLVNTVAGVLIGVAVIGWRHWFPALAAAGFGAATLGAFVLSSTVGLFGITATWAGTYEVVAAVVEAIAMVAGLISARQLWHASARDRARGS